LESLPRPHNTDKSWCHLAPPPPLWLQTWLHINWQSEQVSTTHNAGLRYPPPGNINQHSPWVVWSPSPHQ
jgi:hypothetical protein